MNKYLIVVKDDEEKTSRWLFTEVEDEIVIDLDGEKDFLHLAKKSKIAADFYSQCEDYVIGYYSEHLRKMDCSPVEEKDGEIVFVKDDIELAAEMCGIEVPHRHLITHAIKDDNFSFSYGVIKVSHRLNLNKPLNREVYVFDKCVSLSLSRKYWGKRDYVQVSIIYRDWNDNIALKQYDFADVCLKVVVKGNMTISM